MTAPILLAAESDPAHAQRLRVELDGPDPAHRVIGYLVRRLYGSWVALGPGDAVLGGYDKPALWPDQDSALAYLLRVTGALPRLYRIEESQ